jgi:hypothetical protein
MLFVAVGLILAGGLLFAIRRNSVVCVYMLIAAVALPVFGYTFLAAEFATEDIDPAANSLPFIVLEAACFLFVAGISARIIARRNYVLPDVSQANSDALMDRDA